jgi:large subunit ribosomal protein L4
VVLGSEDGIADRSFGNLPEIQTLVVEELNAYDILVNDWIVFTDGTLPGEVGESRPVAGGSAKAKAEPAAKAEAAPAAEAQATADADAEADETAEADAETTETETDDTEGSAS